MSDPPLVLETDLVGRVPTASAPASGCGAAVRLPVRNANIVVRAADGSETAVGKLVLYRGAPIAHAHVRSDVQRFSLHALAVGFPLLTALTAAGGTEVYLFQKATGVTYRTTVEQLRRFGTLGIPDRFGGKFNLPIERFERISGKLALPWVSDIDRIVIDGFALPWSLPTPAITKATAAAKPAAEPVLQRSLF